MITVGLNPYFIGLSTLIFKNIETNDRFSKRLNPYFIGLSTLISLNIMFGIISTKSQSLFYWIIYSYTGFNDKRSLDKRSLNPYFIGLSTLICVCPGIWIRYNGVSILILLDYLLLYDVLDLFR